MRRHDRRASHMQHVGSKWHRADTQAGGLLDESLAFLDAVDKPSACVIAVDMRTHPRHSHVLATLPGCVRQTHHGAHCSASSAETSPQLVPRLAPSRASPEPLCRFDIDVPTAPALPSQVRGTGVASVPIRATSAQEISPPHSSIRSRIASIGWDSIEPLLGVPLGEAARALDISYG